MKKRISMDVIKLVSAFNKNYPVGSTVILKKDSGEIKTTVRGEAFVADGRAVAFFDGVSGYYSIEGRVGRDEIHG